MEILHFVNLGHFICQNQRTNQPTNRTKNKKKRHNFFGCSCGVLCTPHMHANFVWSNWNKPNCAQAAAAVTISNTCNAIFSFLYTFGPRFMCLALCSLLAIHIELFACENSTAFVLYDFIHACVCVCPMPESVQFYASKSKICIMRMRLQSHTHTHAIVCLPNRIYCVFENYCRP